MARDRKRSKQRSRRTDPAARGPARPSDRESALSSSEDRPTDEAPEPFDHASAEVDIANAQVALGRPELATDNDADTDADGEPLAGGSGLDELQDVPVAATGRDARRARRLAALQQRTAASDDAGSLEEQAAAAAPAPVPAEREREGPRVIAFLQASWRELQRVQWPDRQQVAQATGVVLVFVVIAGLYLGLTGEIASRIVKAIL